MVETAFFRGGTNDGPFFPQDALPVQQQARDRAFPAALCSPDRFGLQLAGIGGISSLSKVMVVARSPRDGVALHNTLGQAAVDDGAYRCVKPWKPVLRSGPFALEAGLLHAADGGRRSRCSTRTPQGMCGRPCSSLRCGPNSRDRCRCPGCTARRPDPMPGGGSGSGGLRDFNGANLPGGARNRGHVPGCRGAYSRQHQAEPASSSDGEVTRPGTPPKRCRPRGTLTRRAPWCTPRSCPPRESR